ncbi:oxygenase MpaB family protein [Curtobacterium sp. MCPF17_052]|uniref:oxygenase MpaB family protein n=1 Tax=Curtobacterium sp. MCPF17_052 TaxID=2175655 RepID=UPI00346415AB
MDGYLDRGELAVTPRTREVLRFIKNPPLAAMLRPGYRAIYQGAVSTLDPRHRALLGIRAPMIGPIELPVDRATGLVLDGITGVLGNQTGSERAAMRRIERLEREAADARSGGARARRSLRGAGAGGPGRLRLRLRRAGAAGGRGGGPGGSGCGERAAAPAAGGTPAAAAAPAASGCACDERLRLRRAGGSVRRPLPSPGLSARSPWGRTDEGVTQSVSDERAESPSHPAWSPGILPTHAPCSALSDLTAFGCRG